MQGPADLLALIQRELLPEAALRESPADAFLPRPLDIDEVEGVVRHGIGRAAPRAGQARRRR